HLRGEQPQRDKQLFEPGLTSAFTFATVAVAASTSPAVLAFTGTRPAALLRERAQRRQPHAPAAQVDACDLHFHAVAQHHLAHAGAGFEVRPELVHLDPAVTQLAELDVALGYVFVQPHDHAVSRDADHRSSHRLADLRQQQAQHLDLVGRQLALVGPNAALGAVGGDVRQAELPALEVRDALAV